MRMWLAGMALILVACGSKPNAAAAPDAADGAGDAALVDATPGSDAADSADTGSQPDTAKPNDVPDTAVDVPVVDVAPVSDVADAAETDAGSATDAAETDAGSAPDADTGGAPDADAGSEDTASADADASTGPLVKGNLVAAGWSFGMCANACKGVLELKGASLLLTTSGWDGTVYYQAKGVLTTGAAAALQDFEAALVGKPLATTVGCPDCADGGASFVTFSDGTTSSTHTYEFGKPPAALGELDKLLTTAIAGLKTCTGDATVVVQNPCPLDLP